MKTLIKYWLRSFVTIVLLLSQSMAHAADEIDLYFLSLPGLLEEDGNTGPLAKVIQGISDRADITFVMHHVPMNRLIRHLQQDVPAIGFPQLGPMVQKRFGTPMTMSPPVVFRHDFAFVRKGTPVPKTVADLEKMVLVTSPITTLPPTLQGMKDLHVIETHSDVSAITLISKGRADVWINDETTTLTAIKAANVNNMTYTQDNPFHVWPAHIVYSNAVNQAVIKRIDDAILNMANDGTLARLLPDNFTANYNDYLTNNAN